MMGCVETITHDKFPKQKDENYKYPQFEVGSRVKVCYHYNTKHYHYGTIVRDDLEEPLETIIKLDNGRYLRGVECQYSYIDEPRQTNADRIRNMSDEELAEFLINFWSKTVCDHCTKFIEDRPCHHECEQGFLEWLQAEVKEGGSDAEP